MKIVFITGGSTGIGAATVRKFIAEGWNVGFMDINTTAAEELKRDINLPSRLLFTEGNTRHRDEIHRAVEAKVGRFGALDAVVANTDIHRCNTLLDVIYFLSSDASSFCTGGHYLVEGGLVAR